MIKMMLLVMIIWIMAMSLMIKRNKDMLKRIIQSPPKIIKMMMMMTMKKKAEKKTAKKMTLSHLPKNLAKEKIED